METVPFIEQERLLNQALFPVLPHEGAVAGKALQNALLHQAFDDALQMGEAAADFPRERPRSRELVAGFPFAAFDPVEQTVADLQILVEFGMIFC